MVSIDWSLVVLGLSHLFSSPSDRSKCLRHARWKFVRLGDYVLDQQTWRLLDQQTSHDFDVPESGMDLDFFLEAVFYLGSCMVIDTHFL